MSALEEIPCKPTQNDTGKAANRRTQADVEPDIGGIGALDPQQEGSDPKAHGIDHDTFDRHCDQQVHEGFGL